MKEEKVVKELPSQKEKFQAQIGSRVIFYKPIKCTSA